MLKEDSQTGVRVVICCSTLAAILAIMSLLSSGKSVLNLASSVACLLVSGAFASFALRVKNGSSCDRQTIELAKTTLAQKSSFYKSRQLSNSEIQQFSATALLQRLSFELSELRRREAAIIDKAADVICIIDTKANFISVSKAARRDWGYAPDELEGLPITRLIESEETSSILDSILGAPESITKISFECKLKKKDETFLDVIWTAYWSASDQGLFCIVHDISERKRSEEIIRQSGQKLQMVLANLPVGVFIINEGGLAEYANTEALRLAAGECENFLAGMALAGKKAKELFSQTQEAAPQSIWKLAEEKAGLEPVEAILKKPDGRQILVDLSLARLELFGQEKQLAVFADKTAKQELEAMKQEFLSMISHDIRTPLTSMQWILKLLEEGSIGTLNEEGKSIAARADAECKRVNGLINELLDLSRFESGRFVLDCDYFYIAVLAKQSCQSLKPLLISKQIELEVCPSELTCFADQERITQVLINLLANAIKFSGEGTKISIDFREEENMVKTSIKDQGRGIPQERLSSVFEKFKQLHRSDKNSGSGLGLSICRSIISEHGGKIGVESKENEGSTFWFTLPKADPDQSQDTSELP